MKQTKEYTVKKDGQILRTYKSLPAATQLAEKEMANVYSGDECVYKVVPEEDTAPAAELKENDPENAGETTKEVKSTNQYTLTTLMNVRGEPSLDATIVTTLPAGTVVVVDEVVDDWLYLSDGTYIFYNGGKFAVKGVNA